MPSDFLVMPKLLLPSRLLHNIPIQRTRIPHSQELLLRVDRLNILHIHPVPLRIDSHQTDPESEHCSDRSDHDTQAEPEAKPVSWRFFCDVDVGAD